MEKIKLTPEQAARYQEGSQAMAGANMAIQLAIDQGSRVIGKAQFDLNDLWGKIGEENKLDVENNVYNIEEKDGEFFVEYVMTREEFNAKRQQKGQSAV